MHTDSVIDTDTQRNTGIDSDTDTETAGCICVLRRTSLSHTHSLSLSHSLAHAHEHTHTHTHTNIHTYIHIPVSSDRLSSAASTALAAIVAHRCRGSGAIHRRTSLPRRGAISTRACRVIGAVGAKAATHDESKRVTAAHIATGIFFQVFIFCF